MVSFLIPLRSVCDLGKNQCGLDRIEHLRHVQLAVRRHAAGVENIGQVFVAAPLGDQSLRELGAAAGHRNQFNLRILLLEFRQHRLVAADVDGDLALFFCGSQNFLPLLLPRRFYFGRMSKSIRWTNRRKPEES